MTAPESTRWKVQGQTFPSKTILASKDSPSAQSHKLYSFHKIVVEEQNQVFWLETISNAVSMLGGIALIETGSTKVFQVDSSIF